MVSTPTPAPTAADEVPTCALTVLYDGACPLCRREIAVYRDLPSEQALRFTDVSDAAQALPAGTTKAQLMARFHVLSAQGELLSGAQAFLALWSQLPGWRWLARLGRLPGMAWLMERAYRGFLRLRPGLQRWAWRLEQGDHGPVRAATGSGADPAAGPPPPDWP